jgi:hypothetical protein
VAIAAPAPYTDQTDRFVRRGAAGGDVGPETTIRASRPDALTALETWTTHMDERLDKQLSSRAVALTSVSGASARSTE